MKESWPLQVARQKLRPSALPAAPDIETVFFQKLAFAAGSSSRQRRVEDRFQRLKAANADQRMPE